MASLSQKVESVDGYVEAIKLHALAALSDLKASSKSVPAYLIEPNYALTTLLYKPNAFVVNGRWFIVYDVGTPWFSDKRVLQEVMVLRIAPGGRFSEVTDFLEAEAKAWQCEAIMAGTFFSTNDRLCSALYQRQGLEQAAIAMIRRV